MKISIIVASLIIGLSVIFAAESNRYGFTEPTSGYTYRFDKRTGSICEIEIFDHKDLAEKNDKIGITTLRPDSKILDCKNYIEASNY